MEMAVQPPPPLIGKLKEARKWGSLRLPLTKQLHLFQPEAAAMEMETPPLIGKIGKLHQVRKWGGHPFFFSLFFSCFPSFTFP